MGGAPRARASDPPPTAVRFNRDVRPILSDKCFTCHGPDKGKRKGGLRLDTEEGARAVLAPGKAGHSELVARITEADPKRRMPPRGGRPLTAREVDVLKRWVAQGARWEPHWAFVAPQRPPAPAVKDSSWARNDIDRFVLARLEREGMRPAPEADRVTLLRRLSFDLTGLPPTPEEVDAFLADTRPGAYERVVDRLLASPRFGERMAIRWLDAARYADTNGYQSDGERTMWRWRDWVIDAYNANRPFDQFTVEQLAGDLLPGATLEQRIATGFNRNHRGNAEGGIIPEEYAVEYVADRVETTATVWMGLTFTCARCHDHKYDPFMQREFYGLFAYFNNVPERGRAVKYGNSPPTIPSPTRDQRAALAALDRRLAQAEGRVRALEPRLLEAQAAWERSARAPGAGAVEAGLVYRTDWAPGKLTWRGGAPAVADGAAAFDGARFAEAGNVGDFDFYDKFTLSAWVFPQGDGAIVSRTVEEPEGDGYTLRLFKGKLQLLLTKRWLDDALRVETELPLAPGRWHHVAAAYDGSRWASGVRLWVDGRPHKARVLLDELNQTFRNSQPLRIGSGGGPATRFRGKLGEVRVHDRALGDDEVAILSARESVAAILKLPPARRTHGQALKVRAAFLARHAPDEVRRAHQDRDALRARRQALVESFPTTMVMEETGPRPTFVLKRGQYDRPGERVGPGVPKALGELGALPPGAHNDRLALARWLVRPEHPLTARVAVNRAWQMLFGAGLVKTVDDFGAQGAPPSHPELLDWLATEYVRLGWDTKALLRLLVTSATYRQSSRVGPEAYRRDPDNRLLARGPRLRLSAEMVRDNALAVSGLLVERLGGPSVKTYQPADLWRELADTKYEHDRGPALYRRGLYTYWKRTVAPPSLITFDAAGREACNVREVRTNTPLQALNLLNDVTYVEAARAFAERALKDGGATPEARLAWLFRRATGRRPAPRELAVLRAGLERHLVHYRRDVKAARELLRAGEAPRDERLDLAEHAAYSAVAAVVLNLDEVVTKE